MSAYAAVSDKTGAINCAGCVGRQVKYGVGNCRTGGLVTSGHILASALGIGVRKISPSIRMNISSNYAVHPYPLWT